MLLMNCQSYIRNHNAAIFCLMIVLETYTAISCYSQFLISTLLMLLCNGGCYTRRSFKQILTFKAPSSLFSSIFWLRRWDMLELFYRNHRSGVSWSLDALDNPLWIPLTFRRKNARLSMSLLPSCLPIGNVRCTKRFGEVPFFSLL